VHDLYNIKTMVSINIMTITIHIEESTKKKLQSFGIKGESYNDIINKIYSMAVKEQLREFLMSLDNTMPISEAITRSKKRWFKQS